MNLTEESEKTLVSKKYAYIELEPKEKLTNNAGMSGSPVFVKIDNKYYLFGLNTGTTNNSNFYIYCLM